MRNGNVSKTRAVLGTTRIDPSPKRAGRVESRGPPIKNSPRSIPVNPVIARAGVWKSASFAYLVGNWNIFRLVRFYCEYDVAEHFSFILEFSLLSCVYVSVCVCVCVLLCEERRSFLLISYRLSLRMEKSTEVFPLRKHEDLQIGQRTSFSCSQLVFLLWILQSI